MTKKVRVGNGDANTSFKIKVEVWGASEDPDVEDWKESETELPHPADVEDFMIHSNQYLVVKEA